MTTAPDVSVCIANYNGIEIIERCISSVVSQVTDCEFEVLVFDDASRDGSPDLIRSRFPKLRTVFSEVNLGFSRASNALAGIANGRYLLFLNNDAFLEPGALQLLWQEGRQSVEILSLRQIDDNTGEEIDVGMGLDILSVPYPLHEHDSSRLVTVIGACLWVPCELFLKAKGFPEWFGSIGEDLYLCLFARYTGANVRVLNEKAYRHISGFSFGGGKAHKPGESTSYRRRFLSERNRFYVTYLFFPPPLLMLLVPAWLILWLLEALILSAATRSLKPAKEIYGKALIEVIRNSGRLRRERRWLRAQRAVSVWEFIRPFSWRPTSSLFCCTTACPASIAKWMSPV
jgi:GT2 family glycosyltransferase